MRFEIAALLTMVMAVLAAPAADQRGSRGPGAGNNCCSAWRNPGTYTAFEAFTPHRGVCTPFRRSADAGFREEEASDDDKMK
ncbi:hypothetical protein BST61_g11414 [Cercospora zeina]